jgi:hypothetical protein
MLDADDARLSQIFVATTGSSVANDTPNAGNPPATTFDLIITGEAGNSIGNSGRGYTLSFQAVDLTTGTLAPAPFNNVLAQAFNNLPWKPLGAGLDFVAIQTFSITLPPNVRGHIFQYTASLITNNSDIISFIKSDQFIIA